MENAAADHHLKGRRVGIGFSSLFPMFNCIVLFAKTDNQKVYFAFAIGLPLLKTFVCYCLARRLRESCLRTRKLRWVEQLFSAMSVGLSIILAQYDSSSIRDVWASAIVSCALIPWAVILEASLGLETSFGVKPTCSGQAIACAKAIQALQGSKLYWMLLIVPLVLEYLSELVMEKYNDYWSGEEAEENREEVNRAAIATLGRIDVLENTFKDQINQLKEGLRKVGDPVGNIQSKVWRLNREVRAILDQDFVDRLLDKIKDMEHSLKQRLCTLPLAHLERRIQTLRMSMKDEKEKDRSMLKALIEFVLQAIDDLETNLKMRMEGLHNKVEALHNQVEGLHELVKPILQLRFEAEPLHRRRSRFKWRPSLKWRPSRFKWRPSLKWRPSRFKWRPSRFKCDCQSGRTAKIKCECLDHLYDVLHKYGNHLAANDNVLLTALLSQLNSSQASVRKRVVSCTASLASRLSDDLLAKATVEVITLLKQKSMKSEITQKNIRMIGSLSRAVGYRFGPYLGDTVPLLMSYCMKTAEIDEELCECSLQVLESFLLRCPRDISSHSDQILHLTLELLCYDPNFAEDQNDESTEEDQDDESADEYTDDEDASWKVRRAAAKCLTGLIVSQPQMLGKLYEEACPKLIDRFKERDENVKMDVFTTFIELLRQTGNVTRGHIDTDELSPRWLLKQELPKIVKAIKRQLREKSVKTKVGAFAVLKELVVLLPDCLTDQMGSLVPGIGKALLDKSSTSNLKIEALVFTRLVLASHSPSVFHPHIEAISGPIVSAVGERFLEVTAEALRVCGEFVRILRPSTEITKFNFKAYVHPIYNAIMARLTNQDQDQEVKECAIFCMGLVISTFGDSLSAELPACLPVLVDRMGNEITRITTVKAFSVIAASPLHVDLSCVLENVIVELTAFLQKANRALRQAALGTLNSIIVAYSDKISSSAYEVITGELSTLISDSDLHMTAVALELCCILMADRRSSPDVCLTVRDKVLPQALTLIRSALLQGRALMALQKFFAGFVYSANASFESLLDSLLSCAEPSPQSGGLTRQALFSIAQCIAILCLNAGDQKCSSTVKMLTEIVKGDSTNNSHLALLCLGEIGRRKDLSAHAHIENIVIESFQSPFEEIKSAASYALGNIAVGNLSKYLPFVLDQIDNQQKKQYLLLHSLKEVIVRQSVDKSEFQNSSVDKILSLLFNHCESEEEGVRNVVAECLGKIALTEPAKLVPALKARTTSPAAFTRATVVMAIKFSLVERPEKIDEILYPEISSFLMLIKDNDRHVRRAAVLALSTAAHNKPNLIKGLLPELLPLLYDQTVVKQELIRTVDLGPFKHVVDDGLELRKAAFECVDTLLDTCLDQVHPSSFIVPHLKSGLDDHYDVKMPCHLILSKLAEKCPSAVLAVVDSLVDPLQKAIFFKPKNDAVKQEVDRNEDMIRSALRAVASINRISSGDCGHKFKNLMNEISKSPTIWDKYISIRNE